MGKNLWGNRGSALVGVTPPLLAGSFKREAFKREFLMYKISGFVLQEHKITESLRLRGPLELIYANPSAQAESPSSAPSPDVS